MAPTPDVNKSEMDPLYTYVWDPFKQKMAPI